MTSKAAVNHIAWSRLYKSGLIEPFSDPVVAAQTLIGMQAQVLRSAGLSVSARLPRPFTETDLGRCLYSDRSLVKLWGQRRTLHLYEPQDWPLIYSVFRDRPTWTTMLTRKQGGDLGALRTGAHDLSERLKEVDVLSRKLALAERPDLAPFLDLGIGLFMDVVQTGAACHAKPAAGESYFTRREKWLPDLAWHPVSREEAGVQLTRRYFAAHGPATAQDVAFWLGEKVSAVRGWLALLSGELAEHTVNGQSYLWPMFEDSPFDLVPPPRSRWPVRLLHRYDVLLLTHKDKSWLIDDKHYQRVWKKAGVVDAVVLVGGRVAGVWRYSLKTRTVSVVVEPFARLSKHAAKGIEREAQRVAHYLERDLLTVEFEPPS